MIHFALIGDVAFNGLISQQPYLNNYRYESISYALRSVRFVFANLEVPVRIDEEKNEYKDYIFHSTIETTGELLKLLNIKCVSLANNHIFDCKMSGLKATIALLDELNILHTGAGWEKSQIEPVIINEINQKIGFLAYVDMSTNPKTEHFKDIFLNYFTPEKAYQDIVSLKDHVDLIICSIHWGNEYSFYPTSEQVNIAHKLVDAGANIIMGHHPHTIQPFEFYKNSHIFYSLGGLTYGDDFWEGNMRSLKRITKRAYIPIFHNDQSKPTFISTCEKKGNYISLIDFNVIKWSVGKWRMYNIRQKSKVINYILVFEEKVLFRIYELLFGYYRNIFLTLFDRRNYKKIKYLFR